MVVKAHSFIVWHNMAVCFVMFALFRSWTTLMAVLPIMLTIDTPYLEYQGKLCAICALSCKRNVSWEKRLWFGMSEFHHQIYRQKNGEHFVLRLNLLINWASASCIWPFFIWYNISRARHSQQFLWLVERSICIKEVAWSPVYQHGLTLIPARTSNHMLSKVWDEITYPFPNFGNSYVIHPALYDGRNY